MENHEFVRVGEPAKRQAECQKCRMVLWMTDRDIEYMNNHNTCAGSPEADREYRANLMKRWK